MATDVGVRAIYLLEKNSACNIQCWTPGQTDVSHEIDLYLPGSQTPPIFRRRCARDCI